MKTDSALLLFLIAQIEKLERFTAGKSEADFLADEVLQEACISVIVSLGEYTQRLSLPFRQSNPQVDWALIKATRNYYVHAYDMLDPTRIWETVINQVPPLKDQLNAILHNEP